MTDTTPTIPLTWESAGTDEPGDQNASSRHLWPGATSAHYAIGPYGTDECWSLVLVQRRHGEEIGHILWTPRGNEWDAKHSAADFERWEPSEMPAYLRGASGSVMYG